MQTPLGATLCLSQKGREKAGEDIEGTALADKKEAGATGVEPASNG